MILGQGKGQQSAAGARQIGSRILRSDVKQAPGGVVYHMGLLKSFLVDHSPGQGILAAEF